MTLYEFQAPNPDDEPVLLTQWRVLRLEGDDGTVVEVLAGRSGIGGDGRVSTPLVSFDVANRWAITRSGRCYQLGAPGFDPDSECVMQSRFGVLIQAGRLNVIDVTDKYLATSNQSR